MTGAQPPVVRTGEPGSATAQATLTFPRYQPLRPVGAAGLRTGATDGGVASSVRAITRSARTNPAPQSLAGVDPAAGSQGIALAGSVMRA